MGAGIVAKIGGVYLCWPFSYSLRFYGKVLGKMSGKMGILMNSWFRIYAEYSGNASQRKFERDIAHIAVFITLSLYTIS